MRPYTIVIILIFFVSCKATYKNIAGSYALENATKTRLILNSDSTFKFIKINRDPYLYSDYHPDQRFYITQGRWQLSNKHILLNSTTDSLTYNLEEIRLDTTRNLKYSTFRFYDIYNDSVGVSYVIFPDSSTIYPGPTDVQSYFYGYTDDMTKVKSLDFVFYGYGYWKYVATDNANHNVTVHFMPVFRPNIFQQTIFSVKGKTITQNKNGKRYKFNRTKSGM